MKHLKIHKFHFKNLIVLAIECKMYLKIQQILHCLGCLSKQTMRSAVKETRLNSLRDDFLMKSFPSSTERKLSILLSFLFHFLPFNGVFLTLKCRTLVLKYRGDRSAAILLKMDIRERLPYGVFPGLSRSMHFLVTYPRRTAGRRLDNLGVRMLSIFAFFKSSHVQLK